MPGKVTLYVRDDDLWERARQASGPGGLSDLVHQSLRYWLDHVRDASPPPTPLERARRLRHDAGALVDALEQRTPAARERRQPTRRRKRTTSRS
jgi:hypothetical protein